MEVARRSTAGSYKLHQNPKHVGSLSFRVMLFVLSAFVIAGVLFCVFAMPSHSEHAIHTNAHKHTLLDRVGLSRHDDKESLTRKVDHWIGKAEPGSHQEAQQLAQDLKVERELGSTGAMEPDWSIEFWSPTDISIHAGGTDASVSLCKLDFHTYSQDPHTYPMNKDLISLSRCNRQSRKLSAIIEEMDAQAGLPGGRGLMPTGFVFHESRVGSTLVANAFASDPFAMVYSESAPPSDALLRCSSCTRENHVKLFRNVIRAMCRSPIHKRCFFKFQSITSTQMEIALEAFPDTPWAFIYRQPVQTMMSHVDPAKGSGGAPCLRGMGSPMKEEKGYVDALSLGWSKPPKEAWCAARLNMLCNSALRAYSKHGTRAIQQPSSSSTNVTQRGLLINYESLPGAIPKLMLPVFGVTVDPNWLAKMGETTSFYSKGRKNKSVFAGDSEKKDKGSTDEIQKYARLILSPTYSQLEATYVEALTRTGFDTRVQYVPASVSVSVGNTAQSIRDWKVMKEMPKTPVNPRMLLNVVVREENAGGNRDLMARPVVVAASTPTPQAHVEESQKHAAAIDMRPKSGSTPEDMRSFIMKQMKHQGIYLPDMPGMPHADAEADSPPVPVSTHNARKNMSDYHSQFDFSLDFEPWIPFANTHHSRRFETPDCPDTPPPRSVYPKTYSILDITGNWLPDNTDIPEFHYDSLCHFDFQNEKERAQAERYREAEVPFVVYNMPELNDVVVKWHNLDYLQEKLGKKAEHRTETSENNHFMYWSGGKSSKTYKEWKPPTGLDQYTFEDWLQVAVKGQNVSMENREHLYFRASGGGRDDSWVFDELPFFRPKKQLFIVQPNQQRGIHCRFGMRNVIAEAHFDGSRNAIALMGGLRRYILTHPDQCVNMHMYPRGHPSARHSAVDWSQPVDHKKFPNYQKMRANEVIMQPGDVLYLPTYWIHYIISLNVNFQCNTRSGITSDFNDEIRKCGF